MLVLLFLCYLVASFSFLLEVSGQPMLLPIGFLGGVCFYLLVLGVFVFCLFVCLFSF